MSIVTGLLKAVWRFAVDLVWGSMPARHDQVRLGQPLSSTTVELQRARERAHTTSSQLGGGL